MRMQLCIYCVKQRYASSSVFNHSYSKLTTHCFLLQCFPFCRSDDRCPETQVIIVHANPHTHQLWIKTCERLSTRKIIGEGLDPTPMRVYVHVGTKQAASVVGAAREHTATSTEGAKRRGQRPMKSGRGGRGFVHKRACAELSNKFACILIFLSA